MIKSHVEIVQEPKQIIEAIVCDKCGKEIKFGGCGEHRFPTEEYITIKHTFGYFANRFADGEQIEVHLCENCMWELLSHNN